MKQFEATIREFGTNQLRHITGEWPSDAAMREELMDLGFWVCLSNELEGETEMSI